ncbi:MAG: transposase [Desulfuromonadales bacterium]|nr:transposase [Desulfuromonadales bacterium]
MLYTKDHKTIDMFDRYQYLGPKRRALLGASWAKLFRGEILPNLPVHLLKRHYDPSQGRPSHELFAIMGVMILQQMLDLNDEQAVEQFCFNMQWHYALNITDATDASSYVCPRSLYSMRRIMTEHNLYQELFEGISDHLCKVLKVDTSLQRLDSVHLFSNMRHLGRIRLFAATIRKFLVNLKRHHQDLFNELPEALRERYLAKRAESTFAMVKPTDSSRTLEELGKDLFFLVERFHSYAEVAEMTTYRLLVRLLSEQCQVAEDPETKTSTVTVKPNREVPSDSLQNPSDPDATYDGHKGKGYQAQVAESYSTEETDQKQLRLITYIEVEPAHKSDAHALLPYLERVAERDLSPTQVLADSLYGSDRNCEEARKQGVELIAPAMSSGTTGEISLVNFVLAETDTVIACPAGHAPERMKTRKDNYSAMFAMAHCAACPLNERCPVKLGKHGWFLRYDAKAARLARRRIREQSEAFRDKYRYRAGAEATMSEFDRRTGVKRLRVRGLKAVRFSVFLKATGLNILRAAAHYAPATKSTRIQTDKKCNGGFRPFWATVKEHMAGVCRLLGRFTQDVFQNGPTVYSQELRLAA